MKHHIAPTLHSAVGGLIAASVIAMSASMGLFVKAFRDLSVPLWIVLLFFSAWIAAVAFYIRAKKQKHASEIARLYQQAEDEILALNECIAAAAENAEVVAENQAVNEQLEVANMQLRDQLARLDGPNPLLPLELSDIIRVTEPTPPETKPKWRIDARSN